MILINGRWILLMVISFKLILFV